ncbi:20S-pre-rRNA D-site endonuclease NOB1 [Plectosphaerella plurivora]|uniref:20S-pre-rRNA D-site endonuclease NOB1 n=1 Tax=Plectosphaerella plurivora TaxID=936078 RepID=A0A9P8VI37_9PEZI|nr:20S-pre-rRNA D-site endonuclease NOB1 [Plectosphaerella plurivora]
MSTEDATRDAPAPVVADVPATPVADAGESTKPIRSICLDTGPLIKNDPPVSTLIAQADELYMLPSILEEIRDVETRTRVQTTLMPFVKLRNPRAASVKFITDFARRTGDLEVMSRPDIHLLALTYELEVEQNGGDWRLRKDPGQKSINGAAPGQEAEATAEKTEETTQVEEAATAEGAVAEKQDEAAPEGEAAAVEVSESLEQLAITEPEVAPEASPDVAAETQVPVAAEEAPEEAPAQDAAEDSDDGWITPSNLKKHQAKDKKDNMPTTEAISLKVALLTSDYAMQNVALRIGLNLLAPSMSRITQVKNWVLRCHGCFQICKQMDKQFCPRCGQPTLTRVSCTTNDDGSFNLHLKRNFQWNTRGNVYSIPKPVAGTASGKLATKNTGGKNGWGTKLMLAEDQKEYERAMGQKQRERKQDIMDEDYLPSLLTGERTQTNGKVRLGPGRGVNGRKSRA